MRAIGAQTQDARTASFRDRRAARSNRHGRTIILSASHDLLFRFAPILANSACAIGSKPQKQTLRCGRFGSTAFHPCRVGTATLLKLGCESRQAPYRTRAETNRKLSKPLL